MNIYSDVIKSLEIKGYKAEVKEIIKNGVAMNGLQIHCTGSNVEPIVYLDDNEELERALEICKNAIDSAVALNIPKELTDPEYLLNNVIVCVEGWRDNCDYLTFTTEFYDMQAYIRVFISDNASFKITEQLLENVNLDAQLVYRTALKNTSMNARYRSMEECLGFAKDIPLSDCLFVIVDNERGTFGAGAILDTELQKTLKEKMNASKLFIIPSSIHEVIAVNADMTDGNLETIIDMVKEVNANVVDPLDVLTDNAYEI